MKVTCIRAAEFLGSQFSMASFENCPTPESLPSLGFLGQSFATSPKPQKRPPEAISRDKQRFEVLRAPGDVVKR